MIAVFGSADLNVADREARRILARAKRAGQAAEAAEKQRLAAELAEADVKVAGFLSGSGPEMTLDELRDAHRVLDLAVKAGVTAADRS